MATVAAGHHPATVPADRHLEELPVRKPLGARPCTTGGVEFRVWAPRAQHVRVRTGGADQAMTQVQMGVHEAVVPGAAAGDDYLYVLDGVPWPDPATRWQPEGMRGPSRVLDTGAFAWSDDGWRPPALPDLVIYELHVGTFSEDGTFEAAIPHLAALAELGVNAIELLPVADGPGLRGWGYDGVYPGAAHRAYGGPQGLARLVDAAHAAGLAVLLDVVYNHVGASGDEAYQAFGPYFTDRYSTFWGEAINYDGPGADGVREWVVQSAVGWIEDFHLDGLRLDAIHAIFDTSARHVVQELAERVHGANEHALVIAESGLNDPRVMQPVAHNGFGCDAAWADDFHHSLRVLLTGETDGYYADFGHVWQLAKAFAAPHVHDGTFSEVRERVFGARSDMLAPGAFVVFSQDHDQVGNRAVGDRMPPECRPLAALCVLLSPFTPMLFMGEEYGEDAPFQFFTDHIDEEIAVATRDGRRREFAGFAGFAAEDVPDPQDPRTFERSKLTRREQPGTRELYARLLALRAQLGHGPVESTDLDERGRWLRVRRSGADLACNFAREERAVPVSGADLALATHADVRLEGSAVLLPPLAGAVIR